MAAYQGYNKINFTKSGANSSHNALQVKLMRLFTSRLTMTAGLPRALTVLTSSTSSMFTACLNSAPAAL
jgi:hypothetical protein